MQNRGKLDENSFGCDTCMLCAVRKATWVQEMSAFDWSTFRIRNGRKVLTENFDEEIKKLLTKK